MITKNLRTILVSLLWMLGIVTASAYDYAYNNMYFNLNRADFTATLTYNTSSYNSYRGEIEIPEVIVGPKDISYTVTAIGDNALRNSTGVSKITIPYTVTSIGRYAMSGCTGLTTVTIPASVTAVGDYAFDGCSKLATLNLNEGLLAIGSSAFRSTALREVSLPATVASISSYCFAAGSTTALESAYLGQAITTLPEGCFSGQSKLVSVKWSDCLKVVGNDAFYKCSSLKSAVFNDSLQSIGSQAFYNCSALSSLTIPSSLTTIGNNAFSGSGVATLTYAEGCTGTLPTFATNTTKVNLPSTVTTITANAFTRFARLTEISIPDGVTTIGASAFEGCTSLALADIPSSVTSIGSRAYYGCSTLKVLKFPSKIETIGSEAFRGCGSLASLSIPACLTSIGTDAFYETGIKTLIYEEGNTTTLPTYATTTTKLALPSSLTSIGANSFKNFTGLTNVSIPESADSIAAGAFRGCTTLTLSRTPSRLRYVDADAFRDCTALTSLTVPATLSYIGADAYTDSGVKELTYADGCTKAIRTYANNTTKLTLPSSLREIEAYAFQNFKHLTGVVLNEGLDTIGAYAFQNCSQLVTLTLPASVTVIGKDAFGGSALSYLVYAPGSKTALRTYSTELSSVVIPASVTTMPADAFAGCSRLENIYITSLEMWNYLFRDKTSNPIPAQHRIYLDGRTLTTLNADFGFAVQPYAFANCKELTAINITASVTGIRENAFSGCSDLEAVVMGSRVFSIGKGAFAGCKALASVRLTPGTKKIDANAFLGCSALNHFHFGGTETYIGEDAFKGCIALENVNIPDGVTEMKRAAFANCSSLQQVVLPSALTTVADSLFSNCVSLRSADFGENITKLGAHAFENCNALQTIQLPDTMTIIDDYCFNDCDSLRYAYLGANVLSLGSYAFAKCVRLVGFYCNAPVAPTCSSNAFSASDPEYINLYVPESAVSAYSGRSPWSSFGSKLSVEDAPKWVQSIMLSAPVVLLKEGESQNLSATINPADATNQKINWSSKNTAVAYVANTGMVLGNDPGSTTITATAADGGGARTSCTVIVDNDYKAVSRITLSDTELTLREGREAWLDATLSPSNPTYGNVVWSSSDARVALVNQSGKVTALSSGTAVITCKAADGKGAVATCAVTVDDAVSPAIGDANDDGEVDVFDLTLLARMILEETDAAGDVSLYDVNNDGEITIFDIVGAANIILGNAGSSEEVSVFSLTPKEISLYSLEQYQLDFIMIPRASSNSVRWRSSNPDVATVDGYGLVSSIKPGETMVYVEADNGRVDSCKVIVARKFMSSITLSQSTFNLTLGDSVHIAATVLPIDADDTSVTWVSDNTDIATVVDGVIRAIGGGTANITCKANDGSGVSATCKVTVSTYHNNHEYVDLGLSVKWATCNVGAEKPEDYGLYFAWGETVGYGQDTSDGHKFEWPYYKWCSNGSWTGMTKYTYKDGRTEGIWYNNGHFVGDNNTVLDPEDDAAHVNWGGSWRMPTKAEQDELLNNCIWTWTKQNGVEGYKVTSKSNGNSIFLPAAGYRYYDGLYHEGLYNADSYGFFWSSSLYADGSFFAYCLYFRSYRVDLFHYNRYHGLSVRAVCGEKTSITLSKTTVNLLLGESEQIIATVQSFNADDTSVTWSSDNTDVATVVDGVILAIGGGTANITCKANDGSGVSATCKVTVPTYHNNHEYVDLGLSVKWATCNIGAEKPEDYGWYLAWGETTPQESNRYYWDSYKWCNGSDNTQTKYCTSSSYGTVDNKTVLDPEDDAAHVNWGGSWRMPTKAEQNELRDNCTWTWTTLNGVYGRKVTGPNGNSIFLPAAGYRYNGSLRDAGSDGDCWSSSLHASYSNGAYCLYFDSDYVGWGTYGRFYGRSVRAVCP